MVARSSRTKATKKRTVKGVAGRNMVANYGDVIAIDRRIKLAGSNTVATAGKQAQAQMALVLARSPVDQIASASGNKSCVSRMPRCIISSRVSSLPGSRMPVKRVHDFPEQSCGGWTVRMGIGGVVVKVCTRDEWPFSSVGGRVVQFDRCLAEHDPSGGFKRATGTGTNN